MLRWCQSTLRTLDGHGRTYASTTRRIPPGVATLAKDTRSSLRYSNNPTDSSNGKQFVTVSVEARSVSRRSGKIRTHPNRRINGRLDTSNDSRDVPPHAHQKVGFNDTKIPLHASPLNPANQISAALSGTPTLSSVSAPKTTNDIIATLRDLLSKDGSIKKPSILAVLALYDNALKQSALFALGHKHFTDIISLCGTLASHPTKSMYDNPVAPRFDAPLSRSKLWSFVAKVGAKKAKLGYDLSLQDRYWMMQARLARARSGRKGNSSLELDSLRVQYEHLQDMSDDPDVHLPYLNFLVSSSNPIYIAEAVQSLCRILERVPDPNPRFPEFLWDIVLVHGDGFVDDLKEMVSRTILHRVDMNPHPRKSTFLGAVTIPSFAPDIIRQEIIRISHLSAAFAASVFPCYNPHHPSQFLARWGIQQARQALTPHLALDIRWDNIVILAASISPKDVQVQYNSSAVSSLDSGNILWRTTLILESMMRKLPWAQSDFGSFCGKVQDVARPLWKTFSNAEISERHVNINRAYVSTFLQIATKSYDERLKGECHHLSQQLGLWNHSQTDHWTTKAQVIDIIASYATAYIACEGRDWRGLFSTISASLPDLTWQSDVTNLLIRRYALENVETSYDLYIHALETGISVSQHALQGLLTELVKHQRWDITTMFLEHPSTTHDNLQLLFGESLFVFQVQQYRYANVAYVRLLAQMAYKLYEHEPPPQSLKYPIRYFLSIMVWTNNVSGMVKLAQLLHHTVPDFFTTRLIRELVLHLVRRRDLPNAFKLFRIFSGAEGHPASRSLEDIQRKLTFRLFKMGAYKAARRLIRGKNQIESLTRREALVHVGLSTLPSPTVYYRHIQRIVSQANADGPTIREAVSLLLKAKRPLSARKLYAKSRSKLDPKTNTVIGNIIVHSPMAHKEFHYARLVRRVVKTKDALVKDYGFTPDRATLNIILKSILRWKTMVDGPKIRRLFDNMVHEGYPVPEQFRRTHGVPFSSPRGPFKALSISSLPVNISFSKHIRPMYKMFIKAFYVRNDVVAAKTVIGILKEVEVLEMRELEKRSRARREGVIRKRMKALRKVEEATLKGYTKNV